LENNKKSPKDQKEHQHWDVGPIYVSKPEDLPGVRGMEGEVDVRSICGGIDESQPVEQYDSSLGVSREFVDTHQGPVGQIQWNSDLFQKYKDPGNVNGVRWASGTLIDRDLFLTAGHSFDRFPGSWRVPRIDGTDETISSEEIALNMHVNFNYQVDPSGRLRREESFPILELLEYREGGLDYAIVRLGGYPGDKYGMARVSPHDSIIGDMLCIIQHPEGVPKRIEAGPHYHTHGPQMGYNSIDTLGGSSGAGILQEKTGAIVGVHTNGGCHLSVIGHNHGLRIEAITEVSAILKQLLSPGWIHLNLHQLTDAPKIKSAPSFHTTTGSRHIVYRSSGGQIHELRKEGHWQHHPITSGMNIPKAQRNPTAYALFGKRTRYVTYLGIDQHIHHLWRDQEWHHVDVSEEAGAPEAASEAAPHISFDGNSQQLYYSGKNGHLYVLWWAGRWYHAALSAATDAAPAAGRPAVCSTARDEHLYVAYYGNDGHIHLLHREMDTWRYTDLMEAAHAPYASGDPAAVLLQGDVHPRIYYRNRQGHIIKIHWVGRWLYTDLTAAAEAPPARETPSVAVAPNAAFATILFRSRQNHLFQLEWRDNRWQAANLSLAAKALEARGIPKGLILYPDSNRYVVYRGKDDHLHELSLETG